MLKRYFKLQRNVYLIKTILLIKIVERQTSVIFLTNSFVTKGKDFEGFIEGFYV